VDDRRFGLVQAVPSIKSYVDRWNARRSVEKVAQIDADLLKVQGNPASWATSGSLVKRNCRYFASIHFFAALSYIHSAETKAVSGCTPIHSEGKTA